MKILIDMNLSPAWCDVLARHGYEAEHWSLLGNPRATDEEIFAFAQSNGYVILTHDLDFAVLLAFSSERGPSVIQVRTHDSYPEKIELILTAALKKYETAMERGALVTVDAKRARVRILPLKE